MLTTRPHSAPLRLSIDDIPNGAAVIYRLHTDSNIISDSPWWSERITPESEYMLPMPGTKPVHIYIKMEDTPGLWFAPTITKHKNAQNDILPLSTFLQGVFILGIIGNILRALAIHKSWPLWAAAFLALCLAQFSLPIPLLSKPLDFLNIPVLIAPGLALIIFAHLGRHLLHTHENGGWADWWLVIFFVLGLATCLVPFLPQTIWITRIAPLWPLLLLLILPVAFWGLVAKQSNAKIFFIFCLLPIIGACISLLALTGRIHHPLAPASPFWGLALAGLALCFARQKKQQANENPPEIFTIMEGLDALEPSETTVKAKPLPSLGYASPKASQEENLSLSPSLTLRESIKPTPGETVVPPMADEKSNTKGKETDEDILPYHAEITVHPYPPTPNDVEEPKQGQVISLVDEEIAHEYIALQNQAIKLIVPEKNLSQRIVPFELETLIQNVEHSVQSLAAQRGVRFSWHITPNTPSFFLGEAVALQQVLFLILQNAVRAIQNGDVELNIRAHSNSGNSYTLVCSISDSGGAGRREAGLQQAWNLAARNSGSFSLEYSPNLGSSMSFSMVLTVPDPELLEAERTRIKSSTDPSAYSLSIQKTPELTELELMTNSAAMPPVDEPEATEPKVNAQPAATTSICRILVADMTTSSRHLLANYLGSLPCEIVEAREAEHVGFVYGKNPVDLIIFDGSMPEADIALSIEAVRHMEESNHLPAANVLALATHETQGQRLLDMGCTHILYKPFSKDELVSKVKECLPAEPNKRPFAQKPQVEEPEDEGAAYIRRLLGEHTLPSNTPSPQGKNKTATPDDSYADVALYPSPEGKDKAATPTPPTPEPSQIRQPEPNQSSTISPTPEPLHIAQPESALEKNPNIVAPYQQPPKDASDTLALAAAQEQSSNKKPIISKETIPVNEEATANTDNTTKMESAKEDVAIHFWHMPKLTSAPGAAPEETTPVPSKPIPARQPDQKDSPGQQAIASQSNEILTPAKEHTPLNPDVISDNANKKSEQSATKDEASSFEILTPAANETSPPAQSPPKAGLKGSIPTAKVGNLTSQTEVTKPKAPAPANQNDGMSSIPAFDGHPLSGIPLQGIEGAYIDTALLPLIPDFIADMTEVLQEAHVRLENGETIMIQHLAAKLAAQTESFGLIKLSKLVNCVERAAEADDMEAVEALLDDLTPIIQKYSASLNQCYLNYSSGR